MSIGAVLLQPQPLTRFSTIGHEQSLGDEALALLQKISMHRQWLDSLASQVADNMDDFVTDLAAHVEARMLAAQSSMQGMVDPLVNALNDLVTDDLHIVTVGDGLQLILALVDKFAAFVEGLSLNQLRSWVEDLLDILFDTLGCNQAFLAETLERFLDIVINAMRTIPAAASNEYIELQWQVAALARRLKRDVLGAVPDLDFNSETIARQLMDALRGLGLASIQEQAQCLAGKVRSLVDAGTSIYDFVRGTAGGGSVGAMQGALQYGPLMMIPAIRSGRQYCWYASWLYQNRRRTNAWKFFGTYLLPLVPKDEVWVSEDGTQLVLRHATEAANEGLDPGERDEVLYTDIGAAPINWYDAPQFSKTSGQDEHFSFTGALSPEFMETWTMVSSLLVTLARFSGHVIHATEPGNHVTHSILAGWHTCRLFAEPITRVPFTSWIRDKWGLGTAHRSWIDALFQWMPVFGGSFEGFNTDSSGGFQHWMTLVGDDAHDDYLIWLWPTLVHEGMLSIFTLINQKGAGYTNFDDTGKPKNHEYSYPLTNVWLVLFSFLQSRALGRLNYSHPFEKTNMAPFLLHQLLFSWMFGAMAGITGELTGWALSRSVSPRRLLIQMGWGAYKGFGTYIVSSYFWNEGDTDGGRFNPNRDNSSGDLEYIEDDEFEGYGDPATSPYRLPIADGRPIFVGQAHQGMFSHFIDDDGSIQIYASDFAFAFREEIVAARDGTVVDYFDWINDDIDPSDDEEIAAGLRAFNSGFLISGQSGADFDPADPDAGDVPGKNFIVIQHNDPFTRESAAEKAHDKDTGGTAVTTYAVYMHGAMDGVREVFATRGIDPPDIIGTRVRRGESILWAGDTGISFHNHLHLHIRPGPDPDPAATPANPQVVGESSDLTGNRTLPVVFRDATHPLKRNGVLQHLTWYKSGNVIEGGP